MQSFLISGKNPQSRETEIKLLCKKEAIDPFDIVIIERGEGEDKKFKPSLGIEDVKRIQNKLYLKPFRGVKKAVIINEAHLLTTEAQNALLKVLEEPPESTLIILTTDNEDALLPTVRSRVSIISLPTEAVSISEQEREEFNEMLNSLPQWESGRVMKLAEKVAKNKDEALLWLEKMILITRESLHSQIKETTQRKNRRRYTLELLKSLQYTYMLIKTTNVNLRLSIETLLLKNTP